MDKRNPAQRQQPGDSPGKYYGAIKAWVDEADNLDDFEDIQLYGHVTNNNQASSREPNQSKIEREPIEQKHEVGEKVVDEVKDNVEVTEMLKNIMVALRNDTAEKKPEKKPVYEPLVRVKRVEQEPERPKVIEKPTIIQTPPAEDKKAFNLQKPTVNTQNKKKENDLQIVDFEKSPTDQLANHSKGEDSNFFRSNGFGSSAQPGGINPFAGAMFPAAKLNDTQLNEREPFSPPADQSKQGLFAVPNQKRMNEPNQSTIGDLSAIAVDTGINRDTLDSRGSFVPAAGLFGPSYKGSQDQILTPGIQIIDSPNGLAIQNAELDSGIFKKPDSPIRIDKTGEANIGNKKNQRGAAARHTTNDRDSKVANALADLVGNADEETDDPKGKGKNRTKSRFGTFLGVGTKKNDKKNKKTTNNSAHDARLADNVEVNDLTEDDGRKTGLGAASTRLQPEETENKDGDGLFEAQRMPTQRIHLSGLPSEPVTEEYKSYRRQSNRPSTRQSMAETNKQREDSIKVETRDGQNIKEIAAFKGIPEHPTQEDEQERANKETIPGRIADETQDTGLHNPNKSRPPSAMSTLFAAGGNSMMLAKGKGKAEGSEKSFPLSKKLTGESELRYEDESPLLINFTKRDVQEEDSILIDHDDSQAHEFLGEQRKVKRQATLIELEEIDVPVSNSMINLFVGFRKKVNKLEYLVQEVRKPEYTIDTFFERNLSCCGGKVKITKNFFFTFLILTGVMLYFIFDTLSANDLSRVKNDSMKQFVANLFIPAAIIFTYYGMAFLYIPIKWLRLLVIAQILPCIGIIGASLGMTFVQDKAFSYTPVYVCAYIIAINVFWGLTRYLKNDIMTNYSWAWSMFYMLSWCILVPTAIIAYAVYVSVVSRRFNYGWAHDLIIHVGIPSLILLCLTWVYYHFKFFVPAAKKKAPALKKAPTLKEIEKENEDKLREQFGEISEDEEEQKEEEKKPLKLRIYIAIKNIIRKISDIIIIASSFSLGGSLIFIEGVLLVYMAEVTTVEKVAQPGAFYLAIFLYFFIPITVLFGVPVIATGKDHEKKMFIVPIVAILFPLFATMPIAYTLMNNNDNGHSIGLFLILAPAIATIFWLTMSYIGIRRKKTKFASLAFIFICFVIPLVILQPMIDIDAFKAVQVAQGFAAFFLAVGIIILIVAALYWICRGLLIKEITQKDRLNTDNYKLINVFKTNLESFGFWANSFGFIVNFTLSLYTFFHSPKGVSPSLNGMSLGLAFCFIIFYIYNAVALKVHVIEVHEISKYGIKSLSAAIIESVRNNELFDEMEAIRMSNEKLKGFCRIFTYIFAPLTAIVSLAVSGVSPIALGIFATMCVGTVVIHIIFEIYGGIKIKYTNIAKSVIPLFLTYIWFTHCLAFPSVLQYTKVFFGDDIQRKKRIEVQLIVLVFVITVSLIAIIANIIFKGIELEQKIKYILAYMRKQLENIAVKSDYFVLQRVFEGWMEQGEHKLKKSLVNRGKPAFWWPVPATNPNTKYSKVLLDFDAYKYMKLRLKQKLENEDGTAINTNKNKKKNQSWLSKCLGCLGLCLPFLFKSKKAQYIDEELNEEIEELLDLQMHEVPLPPKEDGDASDEESDDDYDAGDLGDWKIESEIAENKIEITDINFKPLDERVLRAMMYYDSGIKFAHNDRFTVDFLKFVFRLFAVGNYKFFKKRWLDYLGYKRFMILSAITPTAEFPDYMIDLVYTQYTHNVGRGQIQRRVDYSQKKQQAKKKPKKNVKEIERDQKMRVKVFPVFEEDFEGFLIHIAKRRFPNEINDRDALYRLIRWHLFPNFLHLLPSVQKQYPHEYDYLLYLIDLYMKQDKAAADAAAAAAAEKDSESNVNGEGNTNGINLDAEDGHGTNRPGDGTDRLDANGMSGNDANKLPNLDDSDIKRGPNCLTCIIASICGALTKCTFFFWKKFAGFMSSFFFLKTDAQKKADKEFEKMQRAADAEEKEEVKKIRADKAAETNLGDDPELLEEELNKKGQFRRKRRTYPHKPSPDWPIVVETMIKSLKDAENDYENRKAANKQPFFIPSVRNICFLLAKILEIYAIASLAFRREIPWGWPGTLHDVLAFPSGTSELYKMKVWTSLGLSIFYCYLGLISISFAKEGILGADKATRKAGEFPSRGFAHSITLTIFSTTLSVWIIKSFLDLYSCDYHQVNENLFFMPAIDCGSTLHHWWLVVASVGLLFYYPVSSFLYPNLQYLNVGNDFKYDTSFVVMFNQAKLIMIAVTVFFPYADEVLVPLIVSTVLFIALALINRLLKPNTVRVLNLWETSMYFIGAWIQICGIIAYFSTETALSSTLLLLGIAIILAITYLIHRFRKKIPYEKVPQAESKPILESKPTMEMAKTPIHHRAKESELPLAPLERPGLDLSDHLDGNKAL